MEGPVSEAAAELESVLSSGVLAALPEGRLAAADAALANSDSVLGEILSSLHSQHPELLKRARSGP